MEMAALMLRGPIPGNSPEVVFVSAANKKYWRCLYQLLRGAERSNWHQAGHWLIFDIGMGNKTLEQLKTRFPWCRWFDVDFSELPAHFHPDAGSFAWKPHIIDRAISENNKAVIWLDSSILPRRSPAPILAALRQTGLWLLRGQASLQDRCDPAVLRSLAVPGWLWGTRECVSSMSGFNPHFPMVRELVQRWAAHASDQELIQPSNVTIDRHMHDQALLSALALPLIYDNRLVCPMEDVDIGSGHPNDIASSHNKVSAHVPRFLDPIIRGWYAASKSIDQAVIRSIDKRKAHPRISLKQREYFVVRWRDRTGNTHQLCSPDDHYYADPFLWQHAGADYLFIEDFDFRAGRATIAAVKLAANGGAEVIPVLDPGVHVSFPFLFEFDGQSYMVPESCANGGVDVYRSTDFPGEWTLERRILDNVDATDSIIFPHTGKWWLITSLASPDSGGNYRYLAIFSSNNPVTGDWVAHPINQQGLLVDAVQGSGRNAGGILKVHGQLLRSVQNSRNYYGEGMAFAEIMQLDSETYVERPAHAPDELRTIAEQQGVHHLTQFAGQIAWDMRTRH